MDFIREILNQSANFFLIDEQMGEIEGLIELQQNDEYYLKLVDVSKSISMETFMQTMASSMNFPGYFGHNWSALSDNFKEKIWQAKKEQCVLVFSAVDNLLTQERNDLIDLFGTLKAVIDMLATIKLKIIFLAKDTQNSHLGQAIVNENINPKVIYQN